MNPASNLVLVGPMGAGKTSIGKRLAARLKLDFVDVDRQLEEISGVPLSFIFEREGEAGFRQREMQLVTQLMQGHEQLIATGGGVVLMKENRLRLRENGFVAYLKVSVQQQLERLVRDRSRPLLANGDKRKTLELLTKQREQLYLEIADLIVDSNHLTLSEATEQMLVLIQAHWQRREAA